MYQSGSRIMPCYDLKIINKEICQPDVSARENTDMMNTGLHKVLKNDNVIKLI